jgi:hypothetical protein
MGAVRQAVGDEPRMKMVAMALSVIKVRAFKNQAPQRAQFSSVVCFASIRGRAATARLERLSCSASNSLVQMSSPAVASSPAKAAWLPPLLKATILALVFIVAFSSRLFAVIRFESIIHEFDPWYGQTHIASSLNRAQVQLPCHKALC